MRHGELRSYRGSRLVNEFFLKVALFNIHDTFKVGESLLNIFFQFVFFTNDIIK